MPYTQTIEVSLPELFTIVGARADVDQATKALDQATFMIESISGIVFDGDVREGDLAASDAHWLRKAVVWQAAWLMEQSDALSRMAVSSLSQDGLKMDAQDGLTMVLAPMAKRAMHNCTWNKSSTKNVGPSRFAPVSSVYVSDDHAWTPMAGGK